MGEFLLSTRSFPAQTFLNILIGALFDCTYIPWAALYSEYLEDLLPALQATGWAFFNSIFRFWLASAGMLQPIIAEHFEWGAWVWIVALGVVTYLVTLLVVPGYWGRQREHELACGAGALLEIRL